MPKTRHGHEHAQRERHGGRERSCRRLVARNDCAEARRADEQKERPEKTDVLLRVLEADVRDLLLDGDDDDLQEILPAGALQVGGELARDELRADRQHEHQAPREHDGGVELQEPVLPEDQLIRTEAHGLPPVRGLLASARSRQPRDDRARQDKAQRADQESLPVAARGEVEARQGNGHAQQQAAEEPQRGLLGGHPLANRPPEAPEEDRAEHASGEPRQHQRQGFIHRRPPVPPASPCLPWRPSATR